jgi:hypothetical protein
MGHLSLRGPGGTAPLLGTPKDMLKTYIKRAVIIPCTGISLHRGPIGEPGGHSLAGTF